MKVRGNVIGMVSQPNQINECGWIVVTSYCRSQTESQSEPTSHGLGPALAAPRASCSTGCCVAWPVDTEERLILCGMGEQDLLSFSG